MTDTSFDIALTAWGTWALVAVTIAAVYVGWRAAKAANATFRLEAEPRLIVRVAGEAKIFAAHGVYYRLATSFRSGMPATPDQVEPLDQLPLHLLDGRLGSNKLRTVTNGFDIRMPTSEELNRTQQSPVWPALRIEIRNVGRSPAIQVGLKWNISGPMFNDDLKERFEHGIEVVTKADDAIIIVDAIGPNDSTCIWLGNSTGTPFTLALKSPGYQRDPLDLDSGKTKPISAVAVSTFRLGTVESSV